MMIIAEFQKNQQTLVFQFQTGEGRHCASETVPNNNESLVFAIFAHDF
jgi:hypothetical protein